MAKENDVVLIYFEDAPVVFAKIEEILPDVKKDWYHVKLLMLTIPFQVATWILRDIYINGEEFTMNEKKVRLEKVVCPKETATGKTAGEQTVKNTDSKIIAFSDIKKK